MITLINHQGLKLIEGIQIQTPAPPLGLSYIGAFLKKNGYSYTAIDACGEALDQILPYEKNDKIMVQGLTILQILDKIPADSRLIGFSCSYSHCWPLVEEIAAAARKNFSDAVFVAGGEHPSAMPEHVLKNGIIDVVIRGEGEETFLDLIKKIENKQSWHEIDGIAFLNEEKKLISNNARQRIKDINSFPYPDWDMWCIEKYIEQQQVSGINLGRSMPILGSRGCPYACTFCSNEQMWTRRYIMREGKAIVDEMEYMSKKYNVSGFSFFDSTFIVNRSKTLDFCNELIERNLNISYQLPAGTRCEVFDDELVFALEKSGLKNFSFAPESGSEMIRKVVNKQIKIDTFLKAVKAVKKTKMTVGCFIVLGFPEDNKKTMNETLSFIRKLALIGLDDITVSKFTPYPGSIYFDTLIKEEALSEELAELSFIISFYSAEGRSYSPSLSARQLYRWMNWMYINFYVISFIVRPWRFIKNFWDFFSKGVEKTRYMRFFSEMIFNRRKWRNKASKSTI
jgi:radical SAM superfamily enzyme YgiQ (UPF0313 family)